MSKVKITRVALSSVALEFIETEVKRIKEKGAHYKINEARLASLIIELFSTKYFDKDREEIEGRFFDKKTYLKALIEKSESEDELSKSLDDFFHNSKVKKTKCAKTTKNDSREAIS